MKYLLKSFNQTLKTMYLDMKEKVSRLFMHFDNKTVTILHD